MGLYARVYYYGQGDVESEIGTEFNVGTIGTVLLLISASGVVQRPTDGPPDPGITLGAGLIHTLSPWLVISSIPESISERPDPHGVHCMVTHVTVNLLVYG